MPFCQLLETAKDRQKWKDLVYNLAHHMRPYDLLGLDSVMGQLLLRIAQLDQYHYQYHQFTAIAIGIA